MDAAISSLHGTTLPASSSSSLQPPPHHHHGALPLPLHLRHHRPPPSVSARLTVTARPRAAVAAHSSSAPVLPVPTHSRAATGYAAALADASLRAGTLLRASRHARALLNARPRGQHLSLEELDARVGALVRMLVGKGKAAMVAEVMAEFAAICDHLLPLPHPAPARASSSSS